MFKITFWDYSKGLGKCAYFQKDAVKTLIQVQKICKIGKTEAAVLRIFIR